MSLDQTNKQNMEKVLAASEVAREKEIKDILANDELLKFMQAGLPNSGEELDYDALRERGIKYAEAFSKTAPEAWSFK